jgi:chaperone BCS1
VVSALAANFGLSIYSINLGDFNDRSLMNAVNQVTPNSVLLFEDIDCMKTSKIRELSKTGPNDGGQTPARRKTLLIGTESRFPGC